MAQYAATERAVEAAPPAFRVLVQSFRRHLLAENKAPRTVQTYLESLNRFGAFLAGQGMPTDRPSSAASTSRRSSPTS